MEILEEVLKHINSISSMDIVEFNPLRDEDRKTEQLALNMVARTVQVVEEVKGKIINQKKY
jgi:arginase family enzyme